MSVDELIDAWRVNNKVNLEVLSLIGDDDFELKPGKGKTIRSNFVHLIGVRRLWLEEKMPKEASIVPKVDWKTASRSEILDNLALTSDLMVALFRKMDSSAKVGRFTTIKFFAYCIAHEAHHRSQIEISLRINGQEPDDSKLYALWDWSKK